MRRKQMTGCYCVDCLVPWLGAGYLQSALGPTDNGWHVERAEAPTGIDKSDPDQDALSRYTGSIPPNQRIANSVQGLLEVRDRRG